MPRLSPLPSAAWLLPAFLLLAAAAAPQADPAPAGAGADYDAVLAESRAHFQAGRFPEALSRSLAAYDMARQRLGATDPVTLRLLGDIGVLHQLQGNFDAALVPAMQAAGGLERVQGPDHPDTLNALANLAQLHVRLGQRDLAGPMLRRIFAAHQRTAGMEELKTLVALLELAIFLNADKRLSEIEPLLVRGAAVAGERYGKESGIARDLTDASAAAKMTEAAPAG